jgi:polygalacturonase
MSLSIGVRSVSVLAYAMVAMSAGAWAQDTRTVTEPKIPASCVKLDAKIAAAGDALKEADEANADTARIQGAIDSCKQGEAVELALGAKGSNAFLSGPLELKEGVTLLVDKNVTLFASRRAADYDITGPGTCGRRAAARHSSLSARRIRRSWAMV